MQLFAVGSEDRLKNAFSGVQGIRQPDCAELEKFHVFGESNGEEVNMVEDAHSSLGQVKSLMESGYVTRQKLGVPYHWSVDIYIDQGEYSMREPRIVAEWVVNAPPSAKEILESFKRGSQAPALLCTLLPRLLWSTNVVVPISGIFQAWLSPDSDLSSSHSFSLL